MSTTIIMLTTKKTGRPRASCAECRRSKLKCALDLMQGTKNSSGPSRQSIMAMRPMHQARESRPSLSRLAEENGQLRRQLAERSVSAGPSATVHPAYLIPNDSSPHTSNVATVEPPTVPTVGQLSLSSAGRSRFYAPTAAQHVLPDDESSNDGDQTTMGQTTDQPLPAVGFPFTLGDEGRKAASYTEALANLPSQEQVQRWCDIYWAATCWRFEPVSRDYLEKIVLDIYTTITRRPNKRASQLALLYAVLAVACLFDPELPPHSTQAHLYDSLSLTCLGADDFLVNSSTASLACLHLHCCFLLNDDRPRTDEIYAIVGLALRLATIAGFHRDGIWWEIPQREADGRRRVWWELLTLERINSNRFGCSPFVNPGQFDTLRPTDQHPDSFLSWRWEWDNVLHDMIDQIDAMRRSQDLSSLTHLDESVRAFWSRLPDHLRSPIVDPPLGGRSEIDADLHLQQIRLALHYNTGLLQVHRLAFSGALKTHPEEPADSEHASSVLAITREACPNIVALVEALYSRDPVVALDLFSALVPQAALVIHSPRSQLANDCHHQLLYGVHLLELAVDATPCRWYATLLQRSQKLAQRASLALATRYSRRPVMAVATDVDAMLGNVTRLHEQQVSAPPTPRPESRGDTFHSSPMDDSDFDRWLAALSGTHTLAPELQTRVQDDMDALIFGE
ncbi:hypothetical protein P7C73_g5876, partial [Tremellales sp. Uapishka_1]